jgi:4-hydroxybenzoate polyprenyltransferase
MISFLRLVRFLNLFIVLITILGVVLFHAKISNINFNEFLNFNLFLFILSTILITAAGNIINDYFDIKADKVNKPNRLIVSKNIKRRWAIVLHLSFNTFAFIISLYLSLIFKNLPLVLIPFIAINLLWFYSWYLKKKLIIGNITIAFLTALVPILTVIYLNKTTPFNSEELGIIYLIASFAFLQNLIREIIKDSEDIEGDKLIHVKSIPIYFGKKITKMICLVLLLILPITILISLLMNSFQPINEKTLIFLPIVISGIINIILVTFILFDNFQKLQLYNILIKISLITGITSFYFISLT